MCHCCFESLSHGWLFCDPMDWAPLSMGFPKQEYWSRSPFPSPGGLPDPGNEPASLMCSALAGGFFTTEPPMWGSPTCYGICDQIITNARLKKGSLKPKLKSKLTSVNQKQRCSGYFFLCYHKLICSQVNLFLRE